MTDDVRANVRHAHTIDTLTAKLKELREQVGGDAPIIVDLADSAQECSPVGREGCVDIGMYWAECTWGGEGYLTPEQHAAKGNPDSYDEAPEGSVLAVFIGPTA